MLIVIYSIYHIEYTMMEYMFDYMDPLVCSFYSPWLDKFSSATKPVNYNRYLEDLLCKVGVSAIDARWLDLTRRPGPVNH